MLNKLFLKIANQKLWRLKFITIMATHHAIVQLKYKILEKFNGNSTLRTKF